MMMKIYFCGSIKGGRQKVEDYRAIIDMLKQYGEVLTEHIGNADYAKDGYASAEKIYLQDSYWLRSSDFVVAEVTVASTGVGYELAYAEAHNIPVLCLYEADKKATVSSMILGNSYFSCVGYNSIRELADIFAKNLQRK